MAATGEVIDKLPGQGETTPNMPDYDSARRTFSWEEESRRLDGLPGGGLNIAHEAVERHAASERRDQVALRWIGADNRSRDYTYGDLQALSSRFANVLDTLHFDRGSRVFALCDRIPELYIAALGTLKHGSVFCPLFSAFGPEPLRTRLSLGHAQLLVTTAALYRRKVAGLRHLLPDLRWVLVVPDGEEAPTPPGVLAFQREMDAVDSHFEVAPTAPEDLALLHFTSGTTGRPKGAMHVHGAVLAHEASARLALDLKPGEVFWCTADPGWVTGTSYGIIAPLVLGATLLVDSADFDPERWYALLRDHAVAVWYTAPTAVRMMMQYGSELARQFPLPALRFIASVGEPLNPEAVRWGQAAFGLPIHDNWWQTETGCIMIANYRCMGIKPGSMGKPLPGIEAAIVRREDDGRVALVETPGEEGELALRQGWPSMFRGYLYEDERYRQCFREGWYLSGDLARRDEDGYFWFVARADDVIKSAGHLIGPFEVESALLEHPAVAEAAVIGKPDPVAMEVVKAFVVLKTGRSPDADLQRELMAHARRRLGAAVAPREIAFEARLPRTRSGKILRRLLKARELGQPEGDTSTLEAPGP